MHKPDARSNATAWCWARQLTIDDVGVVSAGLHDRVEYDWAAFDGVDVYSKTIVIWNEPAAGVIIPRQAFDSPQQEQEFVDFVKTKIGGAP